MAVKRNGGRNGSGVGIGFEAKLFQTADRIRNNMDAGEHMHVALGLILREQTAESRLLDAVIEANLEDIGYGK